MLHYTFQEIFPVERIRRICESFNQLNNIPTALLDMDGNILMAVGWQEICTKFHRVNPASCARCVDSDTALANDLKNCSNYSIYTCKNGMTDVAVPIRLEGEHVGNFFTGQFFLEAPNRDFFRAQAKEFGFDEAAYMRALDKVPVHSAEKIQGLVEFLAELTELIGDLGLARKLQLDSLEQQNKLLAEKVEERTKELEEARESAENLALHDPLTGIYNRRAFFDMSDRELSRTKRYGHSLSIAMLDLDHFKRVNDSYGHDVGDKVLIHFAKTISGLIRDTDIFARIGGEEFAILMPETNLDQAAELLERLRAEVEISRATDHEIRYTASFGVTLFDADKDSTTSALTRADAAMYKAKHHGRNRVEALEKDKQSAAAIS